MPEELNNDLWQDPAQVPPSPRSACIDQGYERPGWIEDRELLRWDDSQLDHAPDDIAQWGNDTDRTGPVEVEGGASSHLPEACGTSASSLVLPADMRTACG